MTRDFEGMTSTNRNLTHEIEEEKQEEGSLKSLKINEIEVHLSEDNIDAQLVMAH